jgi:tRNA pseudouridine13 synthase
MKLKQLPHDFIVEEIPDYPISSEKDDHTIFILQKQEVDTFDAVRRIAQRLRLPLFDIGYAGLKDKHALTKQYISIPTRYNVQDQTVDAMILTFVGYRRKKIKIGDLSQNRFTITARDIQENQLVGISQRATTLSSSGVPNYFDSQRFGSVIDKIFIGKEVVLKHYETAVKQYLTAYQKSEPKTIKDEKRRILAQWNTLGHVLVKNKALSLVINEFIKTNDWRTSYRKIPAHLREMYVNAYQSHLWNECVKDILKSSVEKKKLYSVEYAVGSLLFYTALSEQEREKVPGTFQTISNHMSLSEYEKQIIDGLLAREGLSLVDFRIEDETGNFFKTRARQVLLFLGDCTIGQPIHDELNSTGHSERYKLQVSFSLPKGSYATVVTKRLFGH